MSQQADPVIERGFLCLLAFVNEYLIGISFTTFSQEPT
jgi:hypothetical protein